MKRQLGLEGFRIGLAVVRQVADRSGFEAWRQLLHVAPKSKVRRLALLNACVPQDKDFA